jgi:stalled ribosome rescue protein Dom34
MTRHLAVWIDHDQARIFRVDPERVEEATVEAPPRRIELKHSKGLVEGEPPHDSKRFFREVARALEGAEAVLVAGPSTTKLGFFKFLHKHDPTLEPRIVGIETIAHTSDGQFLRYAQRYFALSDPMR